MQVYRSAHKCSIARENTSGSYRGSRGAAWRAPLHIRIGSGVAPSRASLRIAPMPWSAHSFPATSHRAVPASAVRLVGQRQAHFDLPERGRRLGRRRSMSQSRRAHSSGEPGHRVRVGKRRLRQRQPFSLLPILALQGISRRDSRERKISGRRWAGPHQHRVRIEA